MVQIIARELQKNRLYVIAKCLSYNLTVAHYLVSNILIACLHIKSYRLLFLTDFLYRLIFYNLLFKILRSFSQCKNCDKNSIVGAKSQ